MSTTIAKALAALERMTVGELHNRYAEVFGEQARSRHKQYLVRRIAWRIQANAEGGLSERALRRAEELAGIRDIRSGSVARLGLDNPNGACGAGAAMFIFPMMLMMAGAKTRSKRRH